MNLTGLSLVILGLLILGLLGVVTWLVRQSMAVAQQNTSSMVHIQSLMSQGLRDQLALSSEQLRVQNQETRKTLLDSLRSQQSIVVGQFSEMMRHNEILLNRMIAKDPLTVQALDSTLTIGHSSNTVFDSNQAEPNEYDGEVYEDPGDAEELARYQEFARTGRGYIPPMEPEDFTEEINENFN